MAEPRSAAVTRLRAGRVLRARVWRAAGPLLRRVPRDHWESDEAFRRRRRVTGATAVTGAALLGVSLSTPPGSPRFYWLTLGVAGPGSSAGWRPGRCTWDGCSGLREACAARCSRRSSRG